MTIREYLDFWSEDIADSSSKKTILLTEPQYMYNLNKSSTFGTEIEISNNFVPSKEFKIFPTIMIQYVP